MAGGAACLSNSNTRIIVCQIVTYVIIVRQIVTYKFTVFLFWNLLSNYKFCAILLLYLCVVREVCDSSYLS